MVVFPYRCNTYIKAYNHVLLFKFSFSFRLSTQLILLRPTKTTHLCTCKVSFLISSGYKMPVPPANFLHGIRFLLHTWWMTAIICRTFLGLMQFTQCAALWVNCELFSPQVDRSTCADFICAKESDTECQFDLKMTQRYKLCVTSTNCHFFEH